MIADELGRFLAEQLANERLANKGGSGGQSDRSRDLEPMYPGLAYGRHRGPARRGCRQAAVAISLFQDAHQQWVIPLTQRPMTLKHHGGQICLPGGRQEAGESSEQAALREFEEELGVRPQVQTYCGRLESQYVYASDNAVQPVVFIIEPPLPQWQPDPIEVENVILLPLCELFRPSRRIVVQMEKRVHFIETRADQNPSPGADTLQFAAPAFQYQDYRIWGATAMILDELARILLPYHNRLKVTAN
ncbi:NUDIX hydrolase [Rhodopirellula maiorica SM1]|uniref:NUDIX hydrolase n=1 Tax=Rhodopirellula maiorica SM1 TaxID=1265738 RepID=M5S2L0_9BACT|nr:NUDIX hydrolase [Rhodopirellula maiorica SM1]